MKESQIKRIVVLRQTLRDCARPLRDLELLREVMDELMTILLNEPSDERNIYINDPRD
jgi:hypothetical protein